MDFYMTGILLLVLIPVFISLMFIPYLTRKTESFGVSIPEEVYQQAELKTMRKRYATVTGFLSLVVVALFLLLSNLLGTDPNTAGILLSIVIVAFIISSFFVYLFFHHKMKALKATERWGEQKPQQVVINTRFRNKKLIYSNGWFLISFFLALITILFTLLQYDRIPERIPMQYGFNGEVTNWVDKSYRSVLILPILQVYLTLLFLFINSMIARAKQQVSVENPDKSIQQNIVFRRRWSAYLIISGVALTLMLSFIQLAMIYPVDPQLIVIVPLIFSVGISIGAIYLSFSTGQGGSRVKTTLGQKGEVIGIDRDDDQYWKLGQFYFNPNDPALFLEKRFGVGWTINFARPLAWTILLLILVSAFAIPFFLGS